MTWDAETAVPAAAAARLGAERPEVPPSAQGLDLETTAEAELPAPALSAAEGEVRVGIAIAAR